MAIVFKIFISLILVASCIGGEKNSKWYNFRIYPSNVTQSETFIVRHPIQPQILFACANTINLSTGFISEGIYVSTDAGVNWYGSDTCKGAPINFHRGDPGIAIDKNGTFILIRLGFIPGLYSHYSTDNGVSWSIQKQIASEDQDRAALISDVIPTSNYYGRTYAIWVQFSPPFPVVFSYTDDGAKNWTQPKQVNSPVQRCQGGDAAIGPEGQIYACWAGVIPTSPFTEDFVGFAYSTSGGDSWIVKENIIDINGIAGVLNQKANIRVNGLPRIDVDKSNGPRKGYIYIVTTQINNTPAGNDPDIILYRSTNQGLSWSSGIRVNQDPLNNGKIQYFPAIHVDDLGGINIIFYDDRNTTSDSTGVFLARSTDGGETWNEYEISDHNFKPQPIGGLGQGYQGDNINITSSGNIILPVWMDNSTGIYQIWTCRINFIELDIREEFNNIYAYQLYQNYPNPFNNSTNIQYTLNEAGYVSIKVYNLFGQLIKNFFEGYKIAGIYNFIFDGTELASGVYYYKLSVLQENILNNQTPGFTRRMILVK
ncbi:MAG: Cell surface protein [Ignavibacteriae bacterium]|nr:MAG: Cell surface protein [Ignavibacteriota bacterium]